MSVPRLIFLYPHLFKSVRVRETSLPHQHLRPRRKARQKACLSISARCRQETYAQRYGSANEPNPPPPLPEPPVSLPEDSSNDPKSLANAIEKEVQSPSAKPDDSKKAGSSKTAKREKQPPLESKQEVKAATAARRSELQHAENTVRVDAAESHPKELPPQAPQEMVDKPLDHVLQMDSPEEHKPPHLQAPPYVHHFDTFTLVKDLEKGGFTQAQSITLMKAVRSLLAINLDVAREGLVSKSDVENVRNSLLTFHACPPLPLPLNRISTNSTPCQKPGNLPIPRGLLGATHGNPLPPALLLGGASDATRAPAARSRQTVAAGVAGIAGAEGRSARAAQRPADERAHGGARPRLEHPGAQLQNHRDAEQRRQERGRGPALVPHPPLHRRHRPQRPRHPVRAQVLRLPAPRARGGAPEARSRLQHQHRQRWRGRYRSRRVYRPKP